MSSDKYYFAQRRAQQCTHTHTNNTHSLWEVIPGKEKNMRMNPNDIRWIILQKEGHSNVHTLALGCDTSKLKKQANAPDIR